MSDKTCSETDTTIMKRPILTKIAVVNCSKVENEASEENRGNSSQG